MGAQPNARLVEYEMGKHGWEGELPLTFGKLLYSTTTCLGKTWYLSAIRFGTYSHPIQSPSPSHVLGVSNKWHSLMVWRGPLDKSATNVFLDAVSNLGLIKFFVVSTRAVRLRAVFPFVQLSSQEIGTSLFVLLPFSI